ncbi:MAG: DoxX family protein [Bacteroidota bacterium]|nr:DoxX family protein [Bacteroidota bacterium]
MAKFLTTKADSTLTLLRIVLGIVIISHGALRVYQHEISGLGEFFSAHKIPQGLLAAWILTILQIIGGATFLFGRYVKPIGFIFAAGLVLNIYFVSGINGWSLIHAERTGLEYNVVLLTAFLSVALSKSSWT